MSATVIALQGELGSGKTYFAQKLGLVAGVKETMQSPTFVIMKIYDIDPARTGQAWHRFKKLIHIDAYRIEKEDELLNLGWQELVEDPENLILIEWPERVPALIPPDAKRLIFEHHK